MSTVWISKEAWQTVTTALRNIVVRMDRTVQTPSVRFSGAGMSARIHIDLPCTGGGDSGYDGPFALKLKTGEKKKLWFAQAARRTFTEGFTQSSRKNSRLTKTAMSILCWI